MIFVNSMFFQICGEGFMRKSTIENHILERHKFEFVVSSNSEDKDMNVEVSTSQFISVKGYDDVPTEDSYIIVFANEDEELSDPKEMQVTVLAEDGTSGQVHDISLFFASILTLYMGSGRGDSVVALAYVTLHA